MNGKQYILVPKAEYRRLKQEVSSRARPAGKAKRATLGQRDAGDLAEAKRRLAAGNFKPYSELRKELGL